MPEQNIREKILPRYLEEEIKDSYLSYAMSVIVGRALPDIRDGLKPVQRRILYAMNDLHLRYNQPHKKCARIVGECLGKYHPHGDIAVYDALVRMAQEFSLRYPLINGQGNFGCFTKDTKVKLVDGRNLTFEELISEHNNGKKNYTFTFNNLTKRIETAQIGWPRLTRKNAPLLKITLDNKEEIKCTLNHKFMLRDGAYKEAQYLQAGDSLMPLYSRLSEEKDDSNTIGYTMIYQPFSDKWDWAHRLADEWNLKNNIYQKNAGRLRHHMDFNKLNNNPTNIVRLPWQKHWEAHYKEASGRHKDDPVYRLKIAAGRKQFWADENNRKAYSMRMAARNKKMWKNNKYKSEKIAAIKSLWQDKEYRQMRVEASRENLKGLWRQEWFKENLSLLKSAELKKKWRDKKYIEHMREITRKMSILLWNNPLHGKRVSELQKQRWLNPEYRKRMSEKGKKQWEDQNYKKFMANCYRMKWATSASFRDKFIPILRENGRKAHFYRFLKVCEKVIEKHGEVSPFTYEEMRCRYGSRQGEGIVTYEKAINKYFGGDESQLKAVLSKQISKNPLNHKVIKIELLKKTEDVYDLTVNKTHNFALAAGVFVHNSIDGDPPAAMRYSEARMSHIADYILQDIDRDTVKFFPNFDNSLTEPEVLPSILPNLLINGASGIAVGMATNMPSHNLGEVCDALSYLLDNPGASIKELHRHIKGPDFPTGGIICSKGDLLKMYEEGRGKLILRAKSTIEHEKGRSQIIITEIPYQLNKTNLIESIANLITDKRIEGVSDLRDESNKEGIRIVLELKRDVESQIILNQLYKHTNLETTFGAIFLALVNRRPVILSLKEMLAHHISFRKEVIVRRTKFELDKAQKRAHILEGLKIALKFLDKVVELIKKSKNPQEAKEALMKKFSLSEIQAQAILEMQLVRLCALEREKIDKEYLELLKQIEIYNFILSSEKKQEELIKEELKSLKEQFADERRTEIVAQKEEIEIEDLIVEEDMVIAITVSGYIKRQPITSYRQQKRGGRGVTAITTAEEDFVEHLFVASSKDALLIFTDEGKVYPIKTYEVPVGSRTSKGRAIINLLNLTTKEKITKVLSIKEFDPKQSIFMATQKGIVKQCSLELFSNMRKSGICAITLEKDDHLVGAVICEEKDEVVLATKKGISIRFKTSQIRPTGRQSQGVRGIRLSKDDNVLGMVLIQGTLKKEDFYLFTATESGFAKRTHIEEYRLQSRGGKGVINIKISPKIGEVKGLILVRDDDEVMCITQKGILIRTKVKDIRISGRSTQGVRIINVEKGDKLSTIARIIPEE